MITKTVSEYLKYEACIGASATIGHELRNCSGTFFNMTALHPSDACRWVSMVLINRVMNRCVSKLTIIDSDNGEII